MRENFSSIPLTTLENKFPLPVNTDNYPVLRLLKKIRAGQKLGKFHHGEPEYMQLFPNPVDFADLRKKESEPKPTISINEVLSRFPEKERAIIIQNTYAIQLTEGCDGKCPFCFYGLKKEGVTRHFSFESVQNFIRQYGEQLIPEFLWYGNSDPMNYEDAFNETGRKIFVDVFKELEKIPGRETNLVSTAIPLGSETNFLDFFLYIAEKHHANPTQKIPLNLRLSVYRENCRRVEAVMTHATALLLKQGWTDEEINAFYRSIRIGERYKNTDDPFTEEDVIINPQPIRSMVKLINESHFLSISNYDGICITPEGIFAHITVASTNYNPTGFISKPIANINQCPKLIENSDIQPSYARNFGTISQLFLPPVLNWRGEPYQMPTTEETLLMHLGRTLFSVAIVLDTITSMSDSPYMKEEESDKDKRMYLERCSLEIKKFIKQNKSLLDYAKNGDLDYSIESDYLHSNILSIVSILNFLSDLSETEEDIAKISTEANHLFQYVSENLTLRTKYQCNTYLYGRRAYPIQ